MQQHNEGHMKFLLTLSTPLVAFAIYMIYWYLLQIEINKTINLPTGLESVGSHEDFAKKKSKKPAQQQGIEEEPAEPAAAPVAANNAADSDEEKPRRYRITKLRNVVLAFTAFSLSLLAYLLLVVSNASAWLSIVGLGCFIIIGLWQQISEELRRQRLDRIVAIVTLIFLAASFMSLASYASKSLKEGEIYQGKARIVGFDYNSYDNKQGDVTRTDLEVAWGGEWGCPQEDGKQCQAFVQGAMCESEKKDDDAKNNDDGKRTRRYRRRLDENGDGNNGNNNNNNNNKQDEEEQEVEEEEQENENLEEEYEEAEQENEELEEDLEEEEEYAEELEEEVENGADYNYYWDDDMMYDSYWDDQDWGSIWGEYACYDLFDYDMSGNEYDADEIPGKDDWPFVNIYGNCRSCDAYIVDYFSTEHFQSLQNFRVQGRNYLILSLFGLVLTGFLHFKHRMDPIAEKELELLPNDGGALA